MTGRDFFWKIKMTGQRLFRRKKMTDEDFSPDKNPTRLELFMKEKLWFIFSLFLGNSYYDNRKQFARTIHLLIMQSIHNRYSAGLTQQEV